MTEFRGFPPELFTFFEELEKDNSKSFSDAHKPVWEEQVRAPMRALLDELAEEFGQLRMFRPNRDVRFSKDKSPYKLWVGATSESRAVGGTGYYIKVSATRLITGFGAMLMARDQLERFRAAIDDEQSGRASEMLAPNRSRSPPASNRPEDRTPRLPPRTTPARSSCAGRAQLSFRNTTGADWMHSSEALERIRTIWRGAAPLKAWLDAHVGASETPVR